ncbi:tubulin epsilon and delta complex protein 1 [Hyperolius riggenbachi]|uniref:tubulin epsilon and delta complex protein 1 n=1 Tax=Hyperolius riggenbachi TaxID=752182 RepID=UPI0035A2AED5
MEGKRVGSIREALCALCRVLSVCGSNCDPETFRKAKFNRPEAALDFWTLLYCILKQICSRNDSTPSGDEKGIHDNQIRYVKCILQIQGYGRPAFYSLSDDGTEGSREILLAFSWLLDKVKILERMLEKNKVHFGDEFTFCMCSQEKTGAVKDTNAVTKTEVDVRHLQWLNGRLRLCQRNLHAAHMEKCNILYKIHSYTQGIHNDQKARHLSPMELEFLRHPEINKLPQCLALENSYLEAYMEWKRLESVYWQWMETVLESTSEDECTTSTQNAINTYIEFSNGFEPRSNLNYIKELHKSFSDVHDQFHELLSRRMLRWQEQVKEMESNLSVKETCLTMKKINREVRKKTEHAQHQRDQVTASHGSYRLVLRGKKSKEAVHKDADRNYSQATDLIKILEAAASKLEAEYQNLQDKSRKELDEITENLEGIVCIPPARS